MTEYFSIEPPSSTFRRAGVSGLDYWSGQIVQEPEVQLQGITGVKQFDLMWRNDPTVWATVMSLMLPIRDAGLSFQGASDKPADRQAAEFCEECFHDMSGSLDDFITDACTMFIYGWSWIEWTLKRRLGSRPRGNLPSSKYDDGRVGFRALDLRLQTSLIEWDIDESDGGINALVQEDEHGPTRDRTVPLSKSLLFRTFKQGNNPEGVSILRPAWRSWRYKKEIERLEAIGLQRALMGMPVVGLGQNYTTEAQHGQNSDEARAKRILKGVHDNTMLGVIEEIERLVFRFETPKMQGITGDSTRVIQRYDEGIVRCALAAYILLGTRERGSYALARELGDLFFMAVQGFLKNISQVVNNWAIPVLMDYNIFPGISDNPEMTYSLSRRIDIETLADFIDKAVGAPILTPDAELEQHIRAIVDFPPRPASVQFEPRPPEGGLGGGSPPGNEMPDEEAASEAPDHFQAEPDSRLVGYRVATNNYQQELREQYEEWLAYAQDSLQEIPPDTSQWDLQDRWKEIVAVGLLAFKKLGYEWLPEAVALGYGGRALPPTLRAELEVEIQKNDHYLERNLWAGVLDDLSPDQLAQAMAFFWSEMIDPGRDYVANLLFWRRGQAQQYSGQFWRDIWIGAMERKLEDEGGDINPVRWVMDEFAKHCSMCPLFAREYVNMQGLIQYTGGILPGVGTECQGWCRCHVETLQGDRWVVL